MSKKSLQIILFVHSAFAIGIAAYLAIHDDFNLKSFYWLCGSALLASTAAVGPDTIEKINFGKDGLEVKRRTPTPEERAEVLEASKDEPNEDAAERLKELSSQAEELAPEQRAPEDYIVLATEAWREKDYELALKYAFKGLSLEPSDKRVKATLIHRLASVYEDLGNNNLAISKYKTAIMIDPTFAWPHNNLGNLYGITERLDEAERACKDAIRIDPTFALPHINLGNVYANTERPDEAELEFKESIRIDPNFSLPHNNLGVLYVKTERHDEAEREYKKSIRIDPNDAVAHNNLGVIYVETDRPDEAEREYKEAIRIDPNYATPKRNMERLYKMTGKKPD